jgi:hypothetical protein
MEQKYIEIWLQIASLVKNPEQVYVYMFSNDIGIYSESFYQSWINLYLDNKLYLLAYQTLCLADSNLKKEVFK